MSNSLPLDPDILESYVLGLTNAEDTARIDALKAESTELQQEILDIQTALESLSAVHARSPRPSLKAGIWSAIQASGAADLNQPSSTSGHAMHEPTAALRTATSKSTTESSYSSKTPSEPSTTSSSTNAGNGSRPSWLRLPNLALVGLGLVSVASIGFIFQMMHKADNLQNELRTEQQQHLSLMDSLKKSQADNSALRTELNFRNSPSTHAIPLFDATNRSTVLARIYVNPNDTLRYIALTEAVEQSQRSRLVLWALHNHRLEVISKYSSVGSTKAGAMLSLNSTPPATDYALTLESGTKPQTLAASQVLALSSPAVLRAITQPVRPKKDLFIAGEPFRSMKRAGRH